MNDQVQMLQQMVTRGGQSRIGGLTKERLLAFFGAKQHENLVLRVVDVMELGNEAQDFLIGLAAGGDGTVDVAGKLGEGQANGWRKRWMLREYPRGYMVLPMKRTIEPLSFEALQTLQAIVVGYTRIRLEKGEPSRIDACDKCGGSGRQGQRRCRHCDGEGQITTLLEMSPEEKQLSEGSHG